MGNEVKVMLGGREYVIAALPIAKSKAWREALAGPFGLLADTLLRANEVEVDQFSDIASIVKNMSGVLLGSVDLMLDLLFTYAPELEKDREWIGDNAYDEEALGAFAEVLKLAFPFGVLLATVTGRTVNKTSSNSQSRNGVLPLPASGPRKSKISSQTRT